MSDHIPEDSNLHKIHPNHQHIISFHHSQQTYDTSGNTGLFDVICFGFFLASFTFKQEGNSGQGFQYCGILTHLTNY